MKLLIKAMVAISCIMASVGIFAERTTTYMHTDALGSVIAASDEEGNLLWRKSFAPYGRQIDNQEDGEKLAYTGKPHDEEMGLTYFGARWYDPLVGRFTGIDPVGFDDGNPQSFNRYAYANNNPYAYIDPDGKVASPFSMHLADVRTRSIAESDPEFHADAMENGMWIAGGLVVGGVYIGSRIAAAGITFGLEIGLIDLPLVVPKKSRGYDRPEVETKSGKSLKQKDTTDEWDNFLGDKQTNIDPRDGFPDPDRIWSGDGKRSIRFGEHEMNSKPNKLHYHQETWHDDKVDNVLQRIPQ